MHRITFANQNPFTPGHATLHQGPRQLRTDLDEPVNEHAASLTTGGPHARTHTQRGALIADTPDALRDRVAAVAALMDGRAHPLTLNDAPLGDAVLTRFDHQPFTRLGPRVQCAYRIDYLQTQPQGAA